MIYMLIACIIPLLENWWEVKELKKVTIEIEDYLYEFYKKVGNGAGRTAEQVISDMLFRFAGESSLRAIDRKKKG